MNKKRKAKMRNMRQKQNIMKNAALRKAAFEEREKNRSPFNYLIKKVTQIALMFVCMIEVWIISFVFISDRFPFPKIFLVIAGIVFMVCIPITYILDEYLDDLERQENFDEYYASCKILNTNN